MGVPPPPRDFEEEKIKRASILVLTLYQKNKDFNNGNSLRIKEQEDISSCLILYDRVNLKPLNRFFWSRFTIFTGLRCFRLEAAIRNPRQFSSMF